jgi:hypothetical protein
MSDSDLQQRLSAYLDGELSEPEADALREQLRARPDLRAKLDRFARADAALGASADHAAGRVDTARLRSAVADRIDAPPVAPSRRSGRLLWWGLSAAALLLVSLSLVLMMMETSPYPIQTPEHGAEKPSNGQVATGRRDLPERAPREFEVGRAPWQRSIIARATPSPLRGEATSPLPRVNFGSDNDRAQPPVVSPLRATDPETAPVAPLPTTVARIEFRLDPGEPKLRANRNGELLRKLEVVLAHAATLGADRPEQWQSLAVRIESDGLIYRCRDARRSLEPDSELSLTLASAEALLVRAELAADWPDEAEAVRQAVLDSDILDRCRRLRV